MQSSLDFVIPGAQKCGTSSLYYLLQKHKSIFLPIKKEPEILAKTNNDFIGNQYENLFSKANKLQLKGEASTNYLYQKHIPALLKEIGGKELKLIFIFRDPAIRAISAYWHLYKLHVDGSTSWYEGRSLEEVFDINGNSYEKIALHEDESILQANRIRSIRLENFTNRYEDGLWPFRYISNGFYSHFVNEYLKYFELSQMHFVCFEEFIVNPLKVYSRILDFLDIDSELEPDSLFDIYNKTVIPKKGACFDLVHFLNPYINKYIKSDTYKNFHLKMFYKKTPNKEGLINKLRKTYIHEGSRLSDITNVNFERYWNN